MTTIRHVRARSPGAWTIRDVLAHFNGWDGWQLVQLRFALNGEERSEVELLSRIAIPDACRRNARYRHRRTEGSRT